MLASVAARFSAPSKFQQEEAKASIIVELLNRQYPELTVKTISDVAKELHITYQIVYEHVNQCRVSGIGTRQTIRNLIKIYKPELLRNLWHKVAAKDNSSNAACYNSGNLVKSNPQSPASSPQ